jgi:hypothetical protein
MKIFFALILLLVCPSFTFANYDLDNSNYQNIICKYKTLAIGNGVIGAPYQEDFEYLLILEPGWLHFIFSHPLDPGQSQEVEEYQTTFHLAWAISYLKIDDHHWTAISVPVSGDYESLSVFFLKQLRQLTFFVDFN